MSICSPIENVNQTKKCPEYSSSLTQLDTSAKDESKVLPRDAILISARPFALIDAKVGFSGASLPRIILSCSSNHLEMPHQCHHSILIWIKAIHVTTMLAACCRRFTISIWRCRKIEVYFPQIIQYHPVMDDQTIVSAMVTTQDSSGVVSPHEMNLAFSVRAPRCPSEMRGSHMGVSYISKASIFWGAFKRE